MNDIVQVKVYMPSSESILIKDYTSLLMPKNKHELITTRITTNTLGYDYRSLSIGLEGDKLSKFTDLYNFKQMFHNYCNSARYLIPDVESRLEPLIRKEVLHLGSLVLSKNENGLESSHALNNEDNNDLKRIKDRFSKKVIENDISKQDIESFTNMFINIPNEIINSVYKGDKRPFKQAEEDYAKDLEIGKESLILEHIFLVSEMDGNGEPFGIRIMSSTLGYVPKRPINHK